MRFLPRTLVKRHILILTAAFFIIGAISFSWMLRYYVMTQINLNLSNKAYLFSNTYTLLSSVSIAERGDLADRLTNARVRFELSDDEPEFDSNGDDVEKLFRSRLVYTLATMFKGIKFSYGDVPWDRYISPDIKSFFWASSNFREFEDNIPLKLSVKQRNTPLGLLWATSTPVEKDRLDILARVALPFDDGVWLIAEIRDNDYTAADITFLMVLFGAQFAVLILVAFIEIIFLVRPLKKIQAEAAAINLDSPRSFTVPQDSYLEVQSLAESIRDLTERLSQQIRQRQMTLTSLSHDLRSPVCKINMQMEKLERGGHGASAAIRNSLAELQRVMDSVLSYARGGNINEEPREVYMPSLLESLADDYADQNEPVRVERADPCRILLYPDLMYRCLDNLIRNSVDYAQDAAGCDDASGCDVILNGIDELESYRITVRDFGPGMAEEDLVRVFEPFVRLENSRSRKTGGTGLGLSIAANQARSNRAEIKLHNAHPGLLAEVIIFKNVTLPGMENEKQV
ncbi:MAG: HAMP domain-containing histidine kinase [Mailhella sp.]|nr:HAMP domain-containing histidine kinase [Mailhella sp.]